MKLWPPLEPPMQLNLLRLTGIELSTNALQSMVCSISTKWKQPVTFSLEILLILLYLKPRFYNSDINWKVTVQKSVSRMMFHRPHALRLHEPRCPGAPSSAPVPQPALSSVPAPPAPSSVSESTSPVPEPLWQLNAMGSLSPPLSNPGPEASRTHTE